MRQNALPALILLLLGAALADWLSMDEARAQALPPSGSTYTHPSAISLPNGIDSADGGTFVGTVQASKFVSTQTAGSPSIQIPSNTKICLDGVACTAYLYETIGIVTLYGPTISLNGSGLTVAQNGSALFNWIVGGYLEAECVNAGAPAAGDCDADGERGRICTDSTNNRLYFCNGATRGWDYIPLTD